MKPLLTFICAIVVFPLSVTTGSAQLLFQETFKDTTEDITTLGVWRDIPAGPLSIGSTQSFPYIAVKSPALIYTGYIESGNGNVAYLTGGGQDVEATVKDVSTGVVYLAFLIKVDSATVAGDYVWVGRDANTHNRWRMWIRKDTSGGSDNTYNFGLGMSAGSKQYATETYTFGTTYLVISKYDFGTVATNDAKLSLWVNPPLGGLTEDIHPIINNYTEATADFPVINRFALVQNGIATAPTFSIGGMRMAVKWTDVLPPPPLYYNGTGAINDPSSWGNNPDGSGTQPSDFAADNQLYIVRNTTSVNLTAQWVVSGVSSKVIVGSGVNFTVTSGGILAAKVDVNTGGTLTLTESSFWPAFGDIMGIVSFNNASGFSLDADYTFPASTGHFDLTSGDINLSGNRLTVKGRFHTCGYKVFGTGTFTLDSAGALFISSPNGITASGATGDIQASTRIYSCYASYVYNGSSNQVTGDGIPDSVANLAIQMANSSLTTTLSKSVAVSLSGTLSTGLGRFKLGAFNLWFSNPSGQSDSSYVITDGTGSLIRLISNTSKKTMPIGSETGYHPAILTFVMVPVEATNISFRYISGDPGSAGLPSEITDYYKGGSWMITSDGNPATPFRLDLSASGTGLESARVLVRQNETTPWQYAGPGAAVPITSGMISDTVTNFGQYAFGLQPTAIEEFSSVPRKIALTQNFPNPFNPATTIRFDLPTEMHVSLFIYNMLGQQVSNLVDETRSAGRYAITFDASRLTSGVYFYQLQAGSFNQTKKMLLVK